MTEIIRLADHRQKQLSQRRHQPEETDAAPHGPRPSGGEPSPAAHSAFPSEMGDLRRRVRTTGALLATLLIAKLAAVVLWIAPSIVLPADAAAWQTAALAWLGEHTGLRIALLAATGLAFYGALAFAAVSLWPALPGPRAAPARRPQHGRARRNASGVFASPEEDLRGAAASRQPGGARPCS